MTKKYIAAGKIVGVHGIKGAVKVLCYLETPDNFKIYKNFYINNEKIKLKHNFTKGNIAVVELGNIKDRNEAEKFTNLEIFIEASELPELGKNEYYYNDLLGLKLFNIKDGTEIGEIVNIGNFGAGDLVEIKFKETGKKPRLVNFNKENFPDIDIKNKIAKTDLPEEDFAKEE